jgi:hypothetical protein
MVAAKSGSRWRSVTCETEVVIVRAAGDLDLECGGQKMVPHSAEAAVAAAPTTGLDGGTLIGKRYVDEDNTTELLATKGGAGTLALGGKRLVEKSAKPLPASD